MKYYILALKKYFDFNTTSTRLDFWLFFLFNLIFSLIFAFLDAILGTWPLLNIIYILLLFIPGISVGVRRLHDTGRSGWQLLLGLIPIVGWLYIFLIFLIGSKKQNNKYKNGAGNNNHEIQDINKIRIILEIIIAIIIAVVLFNIFVSTMTLRSYDSFKQILLKQEGDFGFIPTENLQQIRYDENILEAKYNNGQIITHGSVKKNIGIFTNKYMNKSEASLVTNQSIDISGEEKWSQFSEYWDYYYSSISNFIGEEIYVTYYGDQKSIYSIYNIWNINEDSPIESYKAVTRGSWIQSLGNLEEEAKNKNMTINELEDTYLSRINFIEKEGYLIGWVRGQAPEFSPESVLIFEDTLID
jgi:uncharacterized membrane protein YhaH (DUF805 family)